MRTKRYLIVLDLDGTTLNDEKEISPTTFSYLQELSRRGHLVVFATGRPLSWVNKYHEQLKLKTPIICYNGALIKECPDSNYESMFFPLKKELVLNLWNKFKKQAKNIMVQINNDLYMEHEENFFEMFPWTRQYVKDYHVKQGPLEEILDVDPLTMLVRLDNMQYNRDFFLSAAKEVSNQIGIRFWLDAPFFEVYLKGISKSDSMLLLANRYNIPPTRIIAAGDAENDIEMLQSAGISIAMKNAHDLVKKCATTVSKFDNNHDGLYHALKEIFH